MNVYPEDECSSCIHPRDINSWINFVIPDKNGATPAIRNEIIIPGPASVTITGPTKTYVVHMF
jgi:hypothetical protein